MGMTWIALAALLVCALAFYVACENAPGLRRGKLLAYLLILFAAACFAATGYLVLHYLPLDGFAKYFTVIVAVLTGLACFWHGQKHFDRRLFTSALLAAILGVTLFGSAFFLLLGDLARFRESQRPAALLDLSPPQRVEQQLARLADRRQALEARLLAGIPDFRRKLAGDAALVKKELSAADALSKPRLEDELTEIARLMLAVDVEERETGELLSRIRQEQRRLQRVLSSQETLVDAQPLTAELDAMWAEAGTRLSKPLDARLGAGTIAATAVEQKLGELLHNPPP
jgi:hypothetical protein